MPAKAHGGHHRGRPSTGAARGAARRNGFRIRNRRPHEIEVDRFDHEVDALEDEALCDEIIRRELARTVCPISNSYVTDGLEALEVRRMLEKGMRATVNFDDPAYFPGYMNESLVATRVAADPTRNQVVRLAVNAFEASWMPAKEKRALRGRLDRFLEARDRGADDRARFCPGGNSRER